MRVEVICHDEYQTVQGERALDGEIVLDQQDPIWFYLRQAGSEPARVEFADEVEADKASTLSATIRSVLSDLRPGAVVVTELATE